MCCRNRFIKDALVFLVLFVIFLIWATFTWAVAIPWRAWFFGTVTGLLFYGFLHFNLVMLVYCYYYTVTTPPGYVQKNWHVLYAEEGEDDPSAQLNLEKVKKATQDAQRWDMLKVRYCFECDELKPVRAHHCSVCKQCVIRMDHHCPWVSNCVGYNNHKGFVLFLGYASVALVGTFIFYIWRIVEIIESTAGEEKIKGELLSVHDLVQMMSLILSLVIFGPMVIAIVWLFIYQINVALRNTTTIENSLRRKQQATHPWRYSYKWPFDYGKENFSSFFGKKFFLMFLPDPFHHTNPGYHWPVQVPEEAGYAQRVW